MPGSPIREAPSATSQSSPRRGSVKAVADSVIPVAILFVHGAHRGFGKSGIAFGAENRLLLGTSG